MANESLERAMRGYEEVGERYVAALVERGLVFAEPHVHDDEIASLRASLEERGALMRNAGASVSTGWLSKACVECTGTNGSETFSTTFACHRDCYFCFNHNLADYDEFVEHGCPWESVLAGSAKTNGSLACVGLTGGEPLLSLDDSVRFLERAGEVFPGAHRRMYTSGDLLDEEGARRLRDAGLDEIRFSVKAEDAPELRERVLAAMDLARCYIPDVVVEMPIIPGTDELMRGLMERFSEIGIRGMNLLEFCFPFHNWDEFARRGFALRNPPFWPMYDYGYSGGLAVDGSEVLALELMCWALDEGLGFGMHYCSLENKHRSEILQMNAGFGRAHPCYVLDEGDFFIKTAKAFGDDARVVREVLAAAGCRDFVEDAAAGSLAFPPRYLGMLRRLDVRPAWSYNVLERRDDGRYLREVALEPAR